MKTEIDHNEPIPQRNIVLIGLMGCGKSTIGRALAQNLHYPFVDTDEHIEALEKRSITQIFTNDGEDYFRKAETDLIGSLVEMNVQKHIIATGGGLPAQKQNQSLLKKLGYVVWLNADLDLLHERTSQKNHRPLLQNDNPKKTLENLLEQRAPAYKKCAHLTISTRNLKIDDLTHGILESARVYFSARIRHEETFS